jgi:glyoxylase-like metal-dependent hydrolase (beta-lactamase superfamily II)
LSYTPTGQQCPQYKFDGVLNPGAEMRLGSATWQVHAAPGHDPHSVILFEAVSRVLISADALWEAGFGVVFPELDGDDAFDAVGDTLNLIEFLNPAVVIPGHGAAFADLQGALERARRRLDGFVANPQKHLQYATKVLLKFKLLDAQRMERSALEQWIQSTAYFAAMVRKQAAVNEVGPAMDALIQDLVRSGAAGVEGNIVYNI